MVCSGLAAVHSRTQQTVRLHGIHCSYQMAGVIIQQQTPKLHFRPVGEHTHVGVYRRSALGTADPGSSRHRAVAARPCPAWLSNTGFGVRTCRKLRLLGQHACLPDALHNKAHGISCSCNRQLKHDTPHKRQTENHCLRLAFLVLQDHWTRIRYFFQASSTMNGILMDSI